MKSCYVGHSEQGQNRQQLGPRRTPQLQEALPMLFRAAHLPTHSLSPLHYGIDPKFAAKSLMSKRRNLKAQTEDLT